MWIPTACPCKLCKAYIQHVGFHLVLLFTIIIIIQTHKGLIYIQKK